MFVCIYCGIAKSDEETTLEHVIPQCLGGAFLPDNFKTRRVCKTCNSNLGLFVDASFEKSWLVSSWLHQSAMACFESTCPKSIPLMCMGRTEIRLPEMKDDEICELYLGPLGERVLWVRSEDERFYWCNGGNPRTTKDRETRAYFFFSIRSYKNPSLTWLSFKDAFKDKKVRKVFGTEVQVTGASPSDIGFVDADCLDKARIEFMRKSETFENPKTGLSFNLEYDLRFLAKIARGLSFCLFGEKTLHGAYADELKKALWHRAGADIPGIFGKSTFTSMEDKWLVEAIGTECAVVIVLTNVQEGVGINMSLGTRHTATIMCAEGSVLEQKDRDYVGMGKAIVLYPFKQKSFLMPLLDYIGFKANHRGNGEWSEVEASISANKDYFKNL